MSRRPPAPHPSDLQIDLAWRLRRDWRARPLLKRVARHVAAAEGFVAGHLSVAVIGARAMSTLHERYLGRSGPTDVLSFDLGTDHGAGELDGEVIVCADVARRRAARRGGLPRALRQELALYVTHGVLHLAGYDDDDPEQYARMHAREDALLATLGLGRVFSRGG